MSPVNSIVFISPVIILPVSCTSSCVSWSSSSTTVLGLARYKTNINPVERMKKTNTTIIRNFMVQDCFMIVCKGKNKYPIHDTVLMVVCKIKQNKNTNRSWLMFCIFNLYMFSVLNIHQNLREMIHHLVLILLCSLIQNLHEIRLCILLHLILILQSLYLWLC